MSMLVVGVCQVSCFTIESKLGDRLLRSLAQSSACLTLIVGQDKNSLPLVRRTDFTRREYSPRHLVTQLFQIADDCGESQRNVSFDIFEEAGSWSKKANSVCDPWPEVAGIVFTCSLSCGRERLARVSCNEDVHQSVKFSVREGFKIVPKRCDIQESFFHFTDEIGLSEPLKLTICEASQSFAKDVFEAKSNAAISGAEFKSCDGIIHIFIFAKFRNAR